MLIAAHITILLFILMGGWVLYNDIKTRPKTYLEVLEGLGVLAGIIWIIVCIYYLLSHYLS